MKKVSRFLHHSSNNRELKSKNMQEIWKDVKGYEGIYQISNFGNVKSFYRYTKGKLLKPVINDKGYLSVGLYKKGKSRWFKVHILVAIVFLNHIQNDREVDHKDNCRSNNHKDNLQLINHRENSSKDQKKHNRSSQYVGVCWDKERKKWLAQIQINGKHKFLGRFNDEREAHKAYQVKLKEINKTKSVGRPKLKK